MTSPTNIRRVVTADDAEVQTFNDLNEDLKAQKAKMLRATADLEEVKASVPAAAKSAADLATAQAKNTLDTASGNANSAAAAALASLATLPKFRSADATNPPNPTQAELDANPNGIWGVKLNADGVAQQLKWQPHTLAGSWQSVGAPPASAQQVERARLLAVIASAFDSTNAANPRNPTAEEIAAYQAANGNTLIGGSRLNAEGWRQPLIWQGGAWVVSQALPKLDTALLADIAQQQAANDQRQQANDQQVAAKLTQLAPLKPGVFPAGTYINGVQAVFAWLGQDDRPMMWMDAQAKWHFDGGIVADNLAVIKALTLAAATITTLSTSGLAVDSSLRGYVSGVEAVPILADTGGRVALALATDGRLVAPAGIVAPGVIAGITNDADGGVRVDGIRAVPKDFWNVGDSLTAATYPTQLASKSGKQIANWGIGGQSSTEIAARAGAYPTFFTASSNSIPASGGVTVTPTASTQDILRNGSAQSLKGWLGGVYGTLSRTGTYTTGAGTYTFTRTASGSTVATDATAGAQWVPDNVGVRDRITVVWVGRNNFGDADTVIKDIRAILAQQTAFSKRFIVLSVLNADQAGERSTDSPRTGYDQIIALNKRIQTEWPGNFIDIRGILAAGTPDDVPAASLRVDVVHLTDAGYGIVAEQINNFAKWKGWY